MQSRPVSEHQRVHMQLGLSRKQRSIEVHLLRTMAAQRNTQIASVYLSKFEQTKLINATPGRHYTSV